MGDNAVKKIIKIIVPLVLIFVCVTGAFAQGTLSEEILNQAKREAGLFLELKSALGLDWLDEYNAYLENPTDNPEPSWDLSVADLVNGGYLSDSFPSDFTITKSGQEVKISKIITSQAMKDVLPIYLPSVTIAGDVVSLIVQRPEQWVAWQAGLLGKVSRDGSDNPDILPNAVLDFGKGSEIRFINDDGKLVGIDSLTYKGEELEDRFVNAAGDNMTGPLTIEGNKVWHAGNDGSGSGLDADLLDGKDSSFFTNAGNLSSGIVPVARLSGTYDINISGNAATATKLATARMISLTGNATGSASFDGSGNVSINTTVSYASDADTVDGKHASSFVKKAGDTMTGNLTLQGTSINIQRPETSGGYARGIMFYSKDGSTVEAGIGMLGSGNNPPQTLYMGFGTSPWNSSAGLTVTPTNITFKDNKVWHAGNDGTGSGLDADKLDGKHGSDFIQQPIRLSPGTNLNNVTTPGMYYCPLNVEAKQIANVPVGYAFSLLVEKHAGVKQTFTQYLTNSPTIWTRNYYNGTWGPWIKAAQVVEKQRYVSGYWYVGARDRVEGGRRGGSLAGGSHRRRYYYAPNRNASGAKTWYTFDELMTIGSVRAIPNTVGMENLISATFGIEANGVWDSAATIQVFERNPNTGAVTTLVNKHVSRNYVSGSCTIRKGYQYGIVATLHSVAVESYDDGYGAHAWVSGYTYKYYDIQ